MASYSEHIFQARKNLKFLIESNKKISDCLDWQVTVSYYIAVHLINAYLADIADLHYRSHSQVADALNPFHSVSPTKVEESVYLAYRKLQNLSRRSRYMISDNEGNRETRAFITVDKHFKRSLCSLDVLLKFISTRYKEKFELVEINCPEINKSNLAYFKEI